MMENKKKLIAAIIVVAIIGIGSVVFFNRTPKPAENVEVKVTVKEAFLGAIAKVELTDTGKEKFKDAALYRLYDENEQLALYDTEIGKEQTILPPKKPGDKVIVKLVDAKGNEVGNVETVFEKEK